MTRPGATFPGIVVRQIGDSAGVSLGFSVAEGRNVVPGQTLGLVDSTAQVP